MMILLCRGQSVGFTPRADGPAVYTDRSAPTARASGPSAHVHAGRPGDDRDLLTGREVATHARLARRLDPDRHLDQAADQHLQGVAEFIEYNLIEHRERGDRPSRAAPAQPARSATELTSCICASATAVPIGPIASATGIEAHRADRHSLAERIAWAHNTTPAHDTSRGATRPQRPVDRSLGDRSILGRARTTAPSLPAQHRCAAHRQRQSGLPADALRPTGAPRSSYPHDRIGVLAGASLVTALATERARRDPERPDQPGASGKAQVRRDAGQRDHDARSVAKDSPAAFRRGSQSARQDGPLGTAALLPPMKSCERAGAIRMP